MLRVFPNGRHDLTLAVDAALEPLRALPCVPRGALDLTTKGKRGDLGIWLHEPTTAPDLAALAAFRGPVLPVVDQASDARGLPKRLKAFNAFQRSEHAGIWAFALADEVFRIRLGQRPERKVFISYKRDDSEAIATSNRGAAVRG